MNLRLWLLGLLFMLCFGISQSQPRESSRRLAGIAGMKNSTGDGIGAHYEYFLGKKRRAAALIQVSLCFDKARPAGIWYNGAPVEGKSRYPMMVLIQPGFRFYANRRDQPVQYMVGSYLLAGIGKGQSRSFTLNTDNLQERKLAGVLVANGVNVNFRKRYRALLEADMGVGTDNGLNAAIFFFDIAVFGQVSLTFSRRF